MKKAEILSLQKKGSNELGYLSFFESNTDLKFEIKRVYYIYNVPVNTKRGMHAHKNLNQILWSPYGSIEIIVDDGFNKKSFLLDKPEKALIIRSGLWREMYWRSSGSVLCVAASNNYNEDDYIRDYKEFLKYVKEGYWNNENKL